MNSSSPTVSVIVPCYKQSQFLPEAIESLLNQSHPPHEIIVVDDGSPEEVEAVLKPYLDRVTLLRQLHSGVGSARNRGILQACGEFVLFLDSDDTLTQSGLESLLKAVEANPQATIVFGGWRNVDVQNRLISEHRPPAVPQNPIELFLPKNQIPLHCFLVRRHEVARSGLFDPQLRWHEDMEFWIRLALGGSKFASVNQIVANYRRYPGTVSTNRLAMFNSWVLVLDRVKTACPGNAYIQKLVKQGRSECRIAFIRTVLFGPFFEKPSLISFVSGVFKLFRQGIREPKIWVYAVQGFWMLMHRKVSGR